MLCVSSIELYRWAIHGDSLSRPSGKPVNAFFFFHELHLKGKVSWLKVRNSMKEKALTTEISLSCVFCLEARQWREEYREPERVSCMNLRSTTQQWRRLWDKPWSCCGPQSKSPFNHRTWRKCCHPSDVWFNIESWTTIRLKVDHSSNESLGLAKVLWWRACRRLSQIHSEHRQWSTKRCDMKEEWIWSTFRALHGSHGSTGSHGSHHSDLFRFLYQPLCRDFLWAAVPWHALL